MASITIRDLDGDVKERLRVRAAENGRSMEAEARAILEAATTRPVRAKNIGVALLELGDKFGGIELDLTTREEPSKRPIVFSEEWEAERATYNSEMARKREAKSETAR